MSAALCHVPAMDAAPAWAAAAACIQSAEALLITAGAGMGVDSGLPDFRGPEGFWRAYPAIARRGLRFEEMANPVWFAREPQLAWAFYGHRLNLYRTTRPHAGFGRLLALAATKPAGSFVFTSNVDGQFQQAGFPADRLVECHGSIRHFQCTEPCSDALFAAPPTPIAVDPDTFLAAAPLPRCPHCDAVARPNILMFGDPAWRPHRTEAQHERLRDWLGGLKNQRAKLVVVEVGAGNAIPTVRRTSEAIARQLSGTLIRINPRDWEVPSGHYGLAAGAEEGLARLIP
ncbi:MAG TPA: Sir2 family NAD-dependent protein deacetylase [Verrucomicrobiae bacterium]